MWFPSIQTASWQNQLCSYGINVNASSLIEFNVILKIFISYNVSLIDLRDFQDEKGDIIVKYTADEARNLKTYGELPEGTKINETDIVGDEDLEDDVEFDEGAGIDINAI
jgi:hypothetical protein